MAKPRFTSAAYRDLEKIVRYLGARNPGAATRLCDGLERECWRLAQDPEIGMLRPDLAPLLRFLPYRKYLIFYRRSPEGIQVVRIIHSARDYRSSDF